MIPVTKTFLPPIEDYYQKIRVIWETNQITNKGDLASGLESELKEYLDVPNLILTANGTLPLQISLKLLANRGEVITTPFSYVATTSSIVWENCSPVFVDIHPEHLTIDETKIEAAITEKTTAIMATHVFGNPCDVDEIKRIAEKHELKVIYDAAHAFGVKYNGASIFNYGDVSTCSFHATKIFHTGEGGAMFCGDKDLYHRLFYSHNFGHKGELEFYGLGINAKMSELQAGMGLAVLPFLDQIINERKDIVELYHKNLKPGIKKMVIREGTCWNYSYYPVIFSSENELMKVQKALNASNIFPRRYFYPSLNTLNYVDFKEMKNSEDVAEKILCLPLYTDLKESEVLEVSEIINSNIDE